MLEIWKDVKGYEGLYTVSNLGNVKNKNGKDLIKNKSCKYYRVSLRKDKKKTNAYIHRLVATAFIENENNYDTVNHIDENKLNNNVNNLEWCTQEQNNNKYYHKNGIKNILLLNREKEVVGIFKSIRECARFLNYNAGGVSDCLNGKRANILGFSVEYENVTPNVTP